MTIVFFLASAVALFATFLAITGRHPVHALLHLIVSLLGVAVVFFTLGAPFVAALEVVVYAGAIIVLFLFVVMMLNLGPGAAHHNEWAAPSAWILPGLLCLILFAFFATALFSGPVTALGGIRVGPREVGLSLFGPYLLAVQQAAFLLLAGLVGATHLRKRETPAS